MKRISALCGGKEVILAGVFLGMVNIMFAIGSVMPVSDSDAARMYAAGCWKCPKNSNSDCPKLCVPPTECIQNPKKGQTHVKDGKPGCERGSSSSNTVARKRCYPRPLESCANDQPTCGRPFYPTCVSVAYGPWVPDGCGPASRVKNPPVDCKGCKTAQ